MHFCPINVKSTYFCSAEQTAYGYRAAVRAAERTVIQLLTSTSRAEEWQAQPVSSQDHGLVRWAKSRSTQPAPVGRNHQRRVSTKDCNNNTPKKLTTKVKNERGHNKGGSRLKRRLPVKRESETKERVNGRKCQSQREENNGNNG